MGCVAGSRASSGAGCLGLYGCAAGAAVGTIHPTFTDRSGAPPDSTGANTFGYQAAGCAGPVFDYSDAHGQKRSHLNRTDAGRTRGFGGSRTHRADRLSAELSGAYQTH